MAPSLLQGPAVEPVSLDEAKRWLRLDTTSEDDLVAALVTSARLIVEAATRRMLVTQSWRLSLDAWPMQRRLALPLTPLRSLDAIRVLAIDGSAQPLSPSLYTLDSNPLQPRLQFAAPLPAPTLAMAGIQIDVTVGYGDAASAVPEPLRQAIRLLVARWFENRGDADGDAAQLPDDVAGIVAPFRRVRLA